MRPILLSFTMLLSVAAFAEVAEAQTKPAVEWIPARSGNFRSGRTRRIDQVVIHTIEGSQQSGINTFRSGARRVSAHYVVGRGGRIVQMVQDRDTAWHAGSANSRAIGIEHEGFAGRRDTWTPELLRASARLTRWLCDTYGIPIDRSHIIGHVEVPGATHGDPGRFFDWNLYIRLVRGEGGDVPRYAPPRGEEEDGLPPPTIGGNPGGSTSPGSSTGPGGTSPGNPGGSNAGTAPIGSDSGTPDGGIANRLMNGARDYSHANGHGARNPLLERGMRGEDVKRLQRILRAAGFPVAVDGVFGPKTEQALKRFQRARGADVDGIVGPETWRHLNKVKVPPAR